MLNLPWRKLFQLFDSNKKLEIIIEQANEKCRSYDSIKFCSRTFIVFMISFGDFQKVAKETALSIAGSHWTGLAILVFLPAKIIKQSNGKTLFCVQLNGLCKCCARVKKQHGFIYPRFIQDTDQINGLFQFGLLGARSRPCFNSDSTSSSMSSSNVCPLS